MYQLVELNVIQNPLYDPAVVSDPNMTNSVFLRDYATNLLQNAFPHLHKYGSRLPFAYLLSLIHFGQVGNPVLRCCSLRVLQ